MENTSSPDYFDRQKRIPEWKQENIENQICLCLGVGGIGCSVSLGLVRLGVKKLYLVDRDVVDAHNLNRQLLFSKEVGFLQENFTPKRTWENQRRFVALKL